MPNYLSLIEDVAVNVGKTDVGRIVEAEASKILLEHASNISNAAQALAPDLSSNLSRIQKESVILLKTMGFTPHNPDALRFFDSDGTEYFEKLPKPLAFHSGSTFRFDKLPDLKFDEMSSQTQLPFDDFLSDVLDKFPKLLNKHPGTIFIGQAESTERTFRALTKEEEMQLRVGNFDVLGRNANTDGHPHVLPDTLVLSGNAQNLALFKENFFTSIKEGGKDQTIQLSGAGSLGKLSIPGEGVLPNVELSVGPKEIAALLKGGQVEDLLKQASKKSSLW
jgi:hypothetical protein